MTDKGHLDRNSEDKYTKTQEDRNQMFSNFSLETTLSMLEDLIPVSSLTPRNNLGDCELSSSREKMNNWREDEQVGKFVRTSNSSVKTGLTTIPNHSTSVANN